MPLALPDGMLKVTLRSLRHWSLCLLCLLSAASAASADAGSVRLAWDAASEPDVTGYTILYGTRSGEYTSRINVAKTTDYTVTSLPDGIYYFAVQAYTADGASSMPSNQVVATIGTVGIVLPGGCTTSDPFAAMGGGTCMNGGWLPPGSGSTLHVSPPTPPAPTAPVTAGGCTTSDPFAAIGGGTCFNGGWTPRTMTAPGGSTAPPPPSAPPTSSLLPPAATTANGCSTSDPFTSMGGGTCVNGGWLPPGMTSPGAGPLSSSPPPPTPPSGGSVGCATPDPFVAMGGGACYNGGWLPPGMAVPNGGTTTPSSASALPPTLTAQGGCATSDPFVVMGGGTCVNGGWLPPGMDGANGQITVTGTLRILGVAQGRWQIEGDNKVLYTSPSAVPSNILVDGARVTFVGVVVSPASTGVPAVVTILSIETQSP